MFIPKFARLGLFDASLLAPSSTDGSIRANSSRVTVSGHVRRAGDFRTARSFALTTTPIDFAEGS